MKYLTLIPFVLLASCASRPQPQIGVRPTPPSAVEPVEAVRHADVVRAYHVGRYVDPNHSQTMHEQHPVYRIESSARWSLHPGALTTANWLNPLPDAAFVPSPTNDGIFAEMNRQREATQRILSEAARLADSYAELQKVVTEMKNAARDQVLIRTRLAEAEQRITGFAKELQNLTTQPSSQTNDVPLLAPEAPEGPKP
jgi:hypothetical protein